MLQCLTGTAYLKAHYPLEFMAALLEGDLDNFDRVIIDLNECERLGIDVLTPQLSTRVDTTLTQKVTMPFDLGLEVLKMLGMISQRE